MVRAGQVVVCEEEGLWESRVLGHSCDLQFFVVMVGRRRVSVCLYCSS